MTFSPSRLTASFQTGTSATVTVHATAANPSIFNGTVYVYVVDPSGVLADDFDLSSVNASTFAATLHTSPTLPPGRHQGTLQVQLCRDAACAGQYPGSPTPLAYDFTVANSPLNAVPAQPATATAYLGGSLQRTVTVNVSASSPWTVSTAASWLHLSQTSGSGNGTFDVSFDQQGVPLGTQTANVVVQAPDGQRVEVPFSLEVLPNQFTLTTGVPSFTMVNGTTVAAQNLGFALGNGAVAPWTASTTAAWLVATPLAGTTPGTISVRPDPSQGPLTSGSHAASVVLSSAGVPDRSVTTQLSLVRPTLASSAMSITLGGTNGRSLSTAQTVGINLNTGSSAWPWQLSALPAWLSSSATSGSVAQAGTTLSFVPDLAGLTAGSRSTTVTVTSTVNGDTVSVPITVNINADQRRLVPSAWGVGLAATPTGTLLTRSLTVADSFGGAVAWSATSDRSWLSVTAQGNTGGASTLVLTADPSGLANASLNEAAITVTSTAPGTTPAVIRVALWKDATGLASTRVLTQSLGTVVADPVRPYVYANAGTSAISVFHVYTGQLVGTIANAGAALGRMAVSPDGSRLYALDTANRAVAVVNLATRVLETTWPLSDAVNAGTSVLVVRPSGKEIVLIGNGTAYADGTSLGTTNIGTGAMSATANGRRVFVHNAGLSPSSIMSYDLDYFAFTGGGLRVTALAGNSFVNGSSNGKDIAVSPDGSLVVMASGAPYRCSRVDPTDLSFLGSLPGGDAYPNNAEITVDGRMICGADTVGQYDLWVHAANGALIQGYQITSGLRDRELVASADGMVVIALSVGPNITFIPIGPPPP